MRIISRVDGLNVYKEFLVALEELEPPIDRRSSFKRLIRQIEERLAGDLSSNWDFNRPSWTEDELREALTITRRALRRAPSSAEIWLSIRAPRLYRRVKRWLR